MIQTKDNETITWRHPHFWWDALVLAVVWILSFNFPDFVEGIEEKRIFQIIALVASLEMLSYITFNLFGKRHSLIVQGLIGGLASSTTVYVQLTRDQRFLNLNRHQLSTMLLFALAAMLIEALVISVTLSQSMLLHITIMLQLFVSIGFGLKNWRQANHREASAASDFTIPHPIVWPRVLKLTLFIGGLIFVMKLAHEYFTDAKLLAIFITALFEAHAIMAATFLQQNGQPLEFYYFIITLGHCLTKLILVTGTKFFNLMLWPILFIIAISLVTYILSLQSTIIL